ncbi:MAG: thiamine pyrophosphate-dependent enzyme [Negativicutes bacterium]
MLDNTRCGLHNTWSSHHPRSWITSGGMGTMGFGLPAAMGARACLPRQPGDRYLWRRWI